MTTINTTDHEEIALGNMIDERFQRHAHFPLNLGPIDDAQGKAMGVGSCGDEVEITLRLEGQTIDAIGHVPRGCLFTVACASAITALAQGKTVDDALALSPEDVESELGGLPEDHHHCARLAVNTLGEAIAEAYKAIVRSENRED